MIRTLRSAQRSAVKARVQPDNLLNAMLVTATEALRRRLRGLPTKELVTVVGCFRLGDEPDDLLRENLVASGHRSERELCRSFYVVGLHAQLKRLVAQVSPELVSLPGVGTHHAATLLVLASDNPDRLKSEASFASLCGVSPIEASSGKVVRHRRNRGGNRDANRAVHMVCVVRMGSDRRTKSYLARHLVEGKRKWEIMRCLKCYIAREVYRLVLSSVVGTSPIGTTSRVEEAEIV